MCDPSSEGCNKQDGGAEEEWCADGGHEGQDGVSCSLDRCLHWSQLLDMAAAVGVIYDDEGRVEADLQTFCTVLDKYQEQPQLLDAKLESLLSTLLAHFDKFAAPTALVHVTAKYLSHLIKVRGYKAVTRRLPHEVSDVIAVVNQLEVQTQQLHELAHWRTRYVLLLWLSILVMTPFPMTAFDDQTSTDTLTDRIMSMVVKYVGNVDRCREAATLVLARFVTRPDIAPQLLATFLDERFKTLEEGSACVSLVLGSVGCLSACFKHGRRAQLLALAPSAFRRLVDSRLLQSGKAQQRKMALKLLQRIGLTFLPARVNNWRYQRGQRSLADNLTNMKTACATATASPPSPTPEICSDSDSDENDDDIEVPDQIEELIEQVLVVLRDSDTIVRWCGAKTLGRVSARLPRALCNDVVDSLLSDISVSARDCVEAWHGGCLALAELGRRGLLRKRHLDAVVPILLRALVYDQMCGSFTVGSAVRDAACYLCWSLARAVSPRHLRHHVHTVAPALLAVALFDREVSCRRAAAAAFQESVGRQGTWPHGIDIVTSVDYFAVGNRTAAFTKLSVYVGSFSEYTRPLISHLVENKVCHWDVTIRQLAAKALHNMCTCDRQYMSGYVLDAVMPGCLNCDMRVRHGSILAVAEIIHALCTRPDSASSPAATFDATIVTQFVSTLVAQLRQRSLLSTSVSAGLMKASSKVTVCSSAPDLMCRALCRLIECCCESRLSLNLHPTLQEWRCLLDECLCHVDESVRTSAVQAVPAFAQLYHATAAVGCASTPVSMVDCRGDECDGAQQGVSLLDHYLSSVETTDSQLMKRGFVQALGVLPAALLSGQLARVLQCLLSTCRISEHTQLWAECRRDAVCAIATLSCTVGVSAADNGYNSVCPANVDQIYESFVVCLDDYTFDRRGDIGAWVREAAISAIQRVTVLLLSCEDGCGLLRERVVCDVITGLCRMCGEKIDRVRALAGGALVKLLTVRPRLEHVPHRAQLVEAVLGASSQCTIDWWSERAALPVVAKLLPLTVYTRDVQLQLLLAAGSMGGRLATAAIDVLRRYLLPLPADQCCQFVRTHVELLSENCRHARLSVPLMRSLPPLINSGSLSAVLDDAELGCRWLAVTRRELARCGDVHKLLVGVDLLCCLLEFQPACVRRPCLHALTVLLGHKLPRVRRATAQALYETLLASGDDVVDDVTSDGGAALQQVQELLVQTDWTEELSVARAVRDQIRTALDILSCISSGSAR